MYVLGQYIARLDILKMFFSGLSFLIGIEFRVLHIYGAILVVFWDEQNALPSHFYMGKMLTRQELSLH